MKKITFILIIATILITFSCKKDSKVANLINPSASMKCKINGADWSAITRVSTLQANKFIITGTGATGEGVLNVTFFGVTTGTYNLSSYVPIQTQFSATYTQDTNNTDSLYTAINGTATLTKVDTTNKKISGTFSFSAKNLQLLSKQITEGTFNDLVYQ